jgi:hypothetical protein
MGDYAATPVQPIVQGLLTVSGAGAPPHIADFPTFQGRGVSAVVRTALGVYLFTLDRGLPGNAGEVAPQGGAYPLNVQPGAGAGAVAIVGPPALYAGLTGTNIPIPDVRTSFAVRGSSTAVPPGATTVASIGISWLTPGSSLPGGGDAGFTQFQLVFLNGAGAAVDPTDAVAAGVEIIIWVDAQRIN